MSADYFNFYNNFLILYSSKCTQNQVCFQFEYSIACIYYIENKEYQVKTRISYGHGFYIFVECKIKL
jgi:hypothetical protein